MFLSLSRKERRRELRANPFPEDWLRYLQQIALYRLLSETDQDNLRQKLKVMVDEKYWEGCAGLTITDEIKVTIAAQASLLLLGFEDYYFDELWSILVYPGGYLGRGSSETEEQPQYRGGEAHSRGPVILSWWGACWFGRRLGSRTLVIHEFAHKLAEFGDPTEGVPLMDDSELEERWREVMAAEYERLNEDLSHDRPTLLHPYGASNRAEFFAVVTECFFQQPVELRQHHPQLYQVLGDWFRQDPAERPAPDERMIAQAVATEDEYADHLIAECSAAIRLYPNHQDAYRVRAGCYLDQGAYDKAVVDYSAVIRLTPDVDSYCDRGYAYLLQGAWDEALADYHEAIRLCPDYAAPPYWERGVAYARMGDLDRAIADFNRALRADPGTDQAYHERGLAYYQKGEYAKAIADFTEAIRLYPQDAEVYLDRAITFLSQQAYAQAVADCTEAIRLDPLNAEAFRVRAEAYTAMGEDEKAHEDQAHAAKLELESRKDADVHHQEAVMEPEPAPPEAGGSASSRQ
jgi:Mlc titration factor MtfA (ptsG expression regulator)/Tfp pilus assembly protein PilF